MKDESRITGGNKRKIQKRRAPRQSFTAARRQVFLDTLASCANVTASAAAAGAGVSTVYDARRREPDFAEQWADALDAGYATLEALLIERAAKGAHYVPGQTVVPGPETIDTWLALDLLRLSKLAKAPRKAPGAPARRASEQQVAESIMAKLAVLERRRKGAKGKGTKGGEATASANCPRRRAPSPRPEVGRPRPARSEDCRGQPLPTSPRRGEGDLPRSR